MASLIVMISLIAAILLMTNGSNAQLSTNFYSKTCPNVFKIVKSEVKSAVSEENRMGASLLRLFFHDCFVQGCDGSILLDDTSNFIGEKTANPNINSVRGFDVIDSIKSKVEDTCPGIVSCADILAITARDSVVQLGGPRWDVKLGRRDSRTTSLSAAGGGAIPSPIASVSTLISRFRAAGLSAKDMVALSGAHTIGEARCFARKQTCLKDGFEPLDIQTPNIFDNKYFKNLIKKKGVLPSDQVLYDNGPVDSLVEAYSNDTNIFFSDFVAAMVKMGDISPLTGSNGEIRRDCRRVN